MKWSSITGSKQNPGHYSAAVQKNNLLFISGQLPVNPFTGEGVDGSIEKTRFYFRRSEGNKRRYCKDDNLYFGYLLVECGKCVVQTIFWRS